VVVIPGLQEQLLVVLDDSQNSPQLDRPKPKVSGQLDGLDPELGRQFVPVDVNVRWLVRLVAVEVEPIRAGSKYRRHHCSSSHITARPLPVGAGKSLPPGR
jgi:hypothetical protein